MLGRLLVWGGLLALVAVGILRSRRAIMNALGTSGRIVRRGGQRVEREAAEEGAPPGSERLSEAMERTGERLEQLGD